MTDFILELIPQYGIYLIFAVVFLACIGIPLPSSILVLTSGALSAAGDLSIVQVIMVVIVAYCLADQFAFNAARIVGPSLLSRLRKFDRARPVVDRSEAMIERHGWLAVVLSHTIISPTGPYVSYVSGAMKMSWFAFTAAAIPAATAWTVVYCMLGYLFAGELPQMSDLVASMLIVGVMTLCTIGFGIWIGIRWRNFEVAESSP
ncbi:MAG: VTT domain-containing protein [Pseudomonadota bacterium]